jgi:serine/threonine protein kinase
VTRVGTTWNGVWVSVNNTSRNGDGDGFLHAGIILNQNNELSPDATLSHYRLIGKLGAGGMGEVYLAEDAKLNRKVAIKLLPDSLIKDEQARNRMVREAQAVAKLDHPNICPVYEVGEEDERTFIVMQYVEGETLDVQIKQKPLDLSQSISIAAQVADALTEAHAHGIIPCYPLFENDPNLTSLRKDVHFVSLMAKLRKQWQHYQDTL